MEVMSPYLRSNLRYTCPAFRVLMAYMTCPKLRASQKSSPKEAETRTSLSPGAMASSVLPRAGSERDTYAAPSFPRAHRTPSGLSR